MWQPTPSWSQPDPNAVPAPESDQVDEDVVEDEQPDALSEDFPGDSWTKPAKATPDESPQTQMPGTALGPPSGRPGVAGQADLLAQQEEPADPWRAAKPVNPAPADPWSTPPAADPWRQPAAESEAPQQQGGPDSRRQRSTSSRKASLASTRRSPTGRSRTR